MTLMFKGVGARFGQLVSKRSLAYLVLAIIFILLFFWRLGSLPPGLAPQEVAAKASSLSLHTIISHPINAPHKVLQHFFLKLSPESITALRLSSALFACLMGLFFYRLATAWYGKIIGLFGSLIFLTLPLFIVAGRQGSAQIMLFSPIIVMGLYAWLLKTEKAKSQTWVLLVLSAAILAYTPGLIWFIVLGLATTHKRLVAAIADIKPWLSAAVFLAAAGLLVPLAWSLAVHPHDLRQLFLVPEHWSAPLQVLKNIGWMFLALFIKAPAHDPLILGRLPLVNLLVLALLVFGVYAMQVAARAKALWLGGSIVLAVIAAGINNDLVLLALGLPALCLLASAGLRYLYIEWRSIFPRNPVPKTFALILIGAVTLSQVYFGVRYSLVAWPNSVATRTVYVLK